MPNLFRRLLAILAGSSRDTLHRQIQSLKAESKILRDRIAGPVRVTPAERSRLIRLGKPTDIGIIEAFNRVACRVR